MADSVHTAAAVRNCLEPRLAGDDTVVVIIISESGGADALNVASAVLAAVDEGATNSSSGRTPGTPGPARRSAPPPGVSSRVPIFRWSRFHFRREG
ncbi:hypothetical protein BRD14_06845 [Halobacteriales archaeon SW_5_68_122]|nr:MAG: hypothetical protein BRD14_06845 [Halobacteriales archaeon SW_5_68_122]